MGTTKFCRDCQQDRPLEDFGNNASQNDGLQFYCRKCSYARRKRYRQANPEKERQFRKATDLRRAFGITLMEYEDLEAKQRHACAICGGKNGRRRLAVDHDHKTGAIRGLLCSFCNTAIGALHEDPRLFANAVAYLQLAPAIAKPKPAIRKPRGGKWVTG